MGSHPVPAVVVVVVVAAAAAAAELLAESMYLLVPKALNIHFQLCDQSRAQDNTTHLLVPFACRVPELQLQPSFGAAGPG
jgi:hypothetical protein